MSASAASSPPFTSPPSDEIDSIEGIGELDRSGDDGADDHDGDDEKRLGGDQGLRAWCGVWSLVAASTTQLDNFNILTFD